MKKRVILSAMAAAALLTIATPVAAQVSFTVSGNIASGAQFDLHNVSLLAGQPVVATLVCDETAPGNNDRPLDPVLYVFYPGNPNTGDTTFADLSNDDGFGSDDDPNGVDCNAFDSSRVIFTAPVTGIYVFRADGFGSSTGPYTLRVRQPSVTEIPTLGTYGFLAFAALLLGASVLVLRRRQAAA